MRFGEFAVVERITGRVLRTLISGSPPVVMPGVFNAVTAKLAANAGFQALYLSGAGVTNSLTGLPDIGLLTLTEMAQQARYVSAAVQIPVVADADTGYGDVINVARTITELEHAGLAGVHLEDQVSPKRCGHLDGKEVVSTEEMVHKIRSAVQARNNSDFVIIARTDARGVTSFQDAVDRANRYLDAGADAIFPESLQSAFEFEQFAKAVQAPLLANMTEFGKTPLLTASEFGAMGYKMVIFPMTAFRVMMKAAEEAYRELSSAGTQSAFIDRMQTREELYTLLEYDHFNRMDASIASDT